MIDPQSTLVILTGAGISAESGLATFRASDGLWCNHRIEDVATPEGFARNPELVHQFYNARRAQLAEVHPNAAHEALAALAHRWEGDMLIVTQNVDDLHDRANVTLGNPPAYRLLHMHGELKKIRCTQSGDIFPWEADLSSHDRCRCCHKEGTLRPHIVWFHEMPLAMDRIDDMLCRCDLFLSIGTSGNVYPAAGFVQQVRMMGRAHTVELNLEPSEGRNLFEEHHYGPATQIVPAFVHGALLGA